MRSIRKHGKVQNFIRHFSRLDDSYDHFVSGCVSMPRVYASGILEKLTSGIVLFSLVVLLEAFAETLGPLVLAEVDKPSGLR